MTTRVLEHVVRRAGLALRLNDLATGTPVRDGITVTAWPSARPDLAVTTSSVSAAGIAGFTRLPGLAEYDDGSTEREDWFASPLRFPPLPFVVRADDTSGDHLRVIRELLAPTPAPVGVTLPRSPAAPPPPGSLTVVATVVDQTDSPAAWSVVEVSFGGLTTGGVADDRGVVTIPVPRAVPPTGTGTATSGPIWRITVRVRYRAGSQATAPGTAPDDPPALSSLLTQPHALLVDGGPLVGDLQRDLTAAGPLVLSSFPPPASSVLVVRPTP